MMWLFLLIMLNNRLENDLRKELYSLFEGVDFFVTVVLHGYCFLILI